MTKKKPKFPGRCADTCKLIDVRLLESLSKASTQAEKAECIDAAHETWELLMMQSFHNLVSLCNSDQQFALREAQRLWFIYRDSDFASIDSFYSKLENGVLSPDSSAAKMEITRSRALQMLQMRDKLRKAIQQSNGKS